MEFKLNIIINSELPAGLAANTAAVLAELGILPLLKASLRARPSGRLLSPQCLHPVKSKYH